MQNLIETEEPRRSRFNSKGSHAHTSSTDSLLDQDDQQVVAILASQSTSFITAQNVDIEHESIQQVTLLTPLQIKFIIVLLVICNFLIANGVSLQGPFFPKEAGKKLM